MSDKRFDATAWAASLSQDERIELNRAYFEHYNEWAEGVSQWEYMKFAEMMRRCESPIEARLLGALQFMELPLFFAWHHHARPALYPFGGYDPGNVLPFHDGEFAFLYCQDAVLDQYRADFLLVVRFEDRSEIHKLVIECDGHDFHERTKQQAQRDRSRDRALTAAGYKVFRFTGSEIFRDSRKCADEIASFLKDVELQTRK